MNHGVSLLLPLTCVLAACNSNTLEPDSARTSPTPQATSSASGDTILPAADALIRSGAKNTNDGTSQTIAVSITPNKGDTSRAIIKFDQTAVAAAVGSGTLLAARLELPVKESGTASAGNDIDVHRVLKQWTEAGVTWNCGEDLNPKNKTADCPTTGWTMSGAGATAFAPTRTARVHLNPGQAGVAGFDVTIDVQTFLGGQTNHGWLVNPATMSSRAVLWSREAALHPQLVLEVDRDTTRPTIPAFSYPDDPDFVVSSGTTPERIYYRRLMAVVFHDSTSGTTVRRFLAKYQATIAGGMPFGGAYILKFVDPGATLEALTARREQLEAEPSVKYVLLLTSKDAPPVLNARYPEDGSGFERTSWFNNGAKTWAHRAVRAPLSWGCETGTYGGDPVSLATVEFGLDSLHPELRSSVAATFAGQAALSPPLPAEEASKLEWHGTAVAGMLTAAGDNGQGTAGMVWASRLHFYGMGSSIAAPRSQLAAFTQEILPKLQLDNVRVLNLSMDLPKDRNDPSLALFLADAIRLFMQASPGTLVVKAAGNGDGVVQPADILSTSGGVALTDALLRLRSQGFAERIMMVSGTAPGNQFDAPAGLHAGARYIVGQTDVLAPSKDVGVLGSRSAGLPFSGDVVTAAGTSFAAPMVAGVAAQLLAMDPTLTAALVKNYILRGAAAPKIDPINGDSVAAKPVTGIPESAYQLDAYGSLSLLSHERPGTPICGLETWMQGTLEGGTLYFGRNSVETLRLPLPTTFSLAQGGRLLAIHTADSQGFPASQPYRLVGGTWEPQAQEPSGHVYYLERDTAYVNILSDGIRQDLVVRIGSHYTGRSVEPKKVSSVAPSSTSSFSRVYKYSISPTGDWVTFNWEHIIGEDCTQESVTQYATLYAVPLRGGGSGQALVPSSMDMCTGNPSPTFEGPGPMAWRNDGNALVSALHSGDQTETKLRLRRFGVSGSTISQVGATVDHLGPHTEYLSWDPEGGRIRMLEDTWVNDQPVGNCTQVLLRASDLSQVLSRTGPDLRYCGWQNSIAPAVRMATARQRQSSPEN